MGRSSLVRRVALHRPQAIRSTLIKLSCSSTIERVVPHFPFPQEGVRNGTVRAICGPLVCPRVFNQAGSECLKISLTRCGATTIPCGRARILPVNYTKVSSPRRPSPSYIYDDPTTTRPVSPSSSRRSWLLTNLAPSPRSTSSGKAATSATLPPNFCVQLLIVHLRNAFPRTRNPPLFEV